MQVTNAQLSNCAQLNVNELKKIRASALDEKIIFDNGTKWKSHNGLAQATMK